MAREVTESELNEAAARLMEEFYVTRRPRPGALAGMESFETYREAALLVLVPKHAPDAE